MLNLKSLLTKITQDGIFKHKNTIMTGELKLSYTNSAGTPYVAMSYAPTLTSTTIPNLINEVRYSNGVLTSAINMSTYTSGDAKVTGYNNFLYIPHRKGGLNGAVISGSDNGNYGALLAIPTDGSATYGPGRRPVIINYNNTSINVVKEVNIVDLGITGTTVKPTAVSNSNYNLVTGSCTAYSSPAGRINTLTLYFHCTTASWPATQIATLPSTIAPPKQQLYTQMTNSAWTSAYVTVNADGTIYVGNGYSGHDYRGTVTWIS